MMKYSTQAIDKITMLLQNASIKTIDVSVENAVLEILANERTPPKSWKKTDFSPSNVYKDAMDVLAFIHYEDDWSITYIKETKMFEVYVVDKKYSVAAFSLARAIVIAMWNYHLQKTAAANVVA